MDFKNFFQNQNVRTLLIISGIVVLVYLINKNVEKFTGIEVDTQPNFTPIEITDEDMGKGVTAANYENINIDNNCSPMNLPEVDEEFLKKHNEQLFADDLLPKESNEVSLSGKNFLIGTFNGVDSRAITKNANLQLRSDPIIQKDMNASPWMVSTYESDLSRKKFEIGE